MNNKKIGIFIHVWVANNWIEITNEILDAIISYIPDKLHLSDINLCFTKQSDTDLLRKHENIKHFFLDNHIDHESPTINLLHNTCDSYDVVVYLHTKGCSDPTNLKKIHWRRFMLDAIFKYFDVHLLAIDKGFDTSGVLYISHQSFIINNNLNDYNINTIGQHYSGNYWLANSRYIKKLKNIYIFKQDIVFGEPKLRILEHNRCANECWVLSHPGVRFFNINKECRHFWQDLSNEELLFRLSSSDINIPK